MNPSPWILTVLEVILLLFFKFCIMIDLRRSVNFLKIFLNKGNGVGDLNIEPRVALVALPWVHDIPDRCKERFWDAFPTQTSFFKSTAHPCFPDQCLGSGAGWCFGRMSALATARWQAVVRPVGSHMSHLSAQFPSSCSSSSSLSPQ